jgi:uncharacterized protein YndB with AHSA1/START domain
MRLQYERTYPHSPKAVWQALTDPRAIRQWWVDTDFEPVAGRAFFFKDKAQGSWDGMVSGQVLEVNPERLVRFSWKGGGIDTVVTYELTPAANGSTRLVLTHDGFKGLKGVFLRAMLSFGWGAFVKQTLPDMASHIEQRSIDVPFATPSKAMQVRGA